LLTYLIILVGSKYDTLARNRLVTINYSSDILSFGNYRDKRVFVKKLLKLSGVEFNIFYHL